MRLITSLGCLFASVSTCVFAVDAAAQDQFVGNWNCHLECPGGPLQFGIEIRSEQGTKLAAVVTNGVEKIPVANLAANDSEIVFGFDHYDSRINCRIEPGDRLIGTWIKTRGKNKKVEMKFSASKKAAADYKPDKPKPDKPVEADLAGKWLIQFSSSKDPAVGIFEPLSDGSLSGTILTTTGDYRYLHGHSKNGAMELSCFDGAHAFLFRAKLSDDNNLKGDFWSSNTWHETWQAERDNHAALPDAFKQTSLTDPQSISKIRFPDLDGKPKSLVDEQFSAPARLIYVFGSWCPNCHDAAVYFKELKTKYGDDLSILGLAFELTGDFERDSGQVKKYMERHDVSYPVLVAGLSDKKLASKKIPFLDRVRSYPTTVFLDRQNNVIAIHTGFTGPATGAAYKKLRSRFSAIIDKLIDKH